MSEVCKKCNDTGWLYNEGVYGWDYGGNYPCDCEKGKTEMEEYRKACMESDEEQERRYGL